MSPPPPYVVVLTSRTVAVRVTVAVVGPLPGHAEESTRRVATQVVFTAIEMLLTGARLSGNDGAFTNTENDMPSAPRIALKLSTPRLLKLAEVVLKVPGGAASGNPNSAI